MKKYALIFCFVLAFSMILVGCTAKQKDWGNVYKNLNSIFAEEKYQAFVSAETNFAFDTASINQAVENNANYKPLRTVYENIIDESFDAVKEIYSTFNSEPTRLADNPKALTAALKVLDEKTKDFVKCFDQFKTYQTSYENLVASSFNANGGLELAQLTVFEKHYAELARKSVDLLGGAQKYYEEAFAEIPSTSNDFAIGANELLCLSIKLKHNTLSDALAFTVEEFDGNYNKTIVQTLTKETLTTKIEKLEYDKTNIATKISGADAENLTTALRSLEAKMLAQDNERARVVETLKEYDYSEDEIVVENEDDAVKKARIEFVKNYINSLHNKECDAFASIVDLLN